MDRSVLSETVPRNWSWGGGVENYATHKEVLSIKETLYFILGVTLGTWDLSNQISLSTEELWIILCPDYRAHDFQDEVSSHWHQSHVHTCQILYEMTMKLWHMRLILSNRKLKFGRCGPRDLIYDWCFCFHLLTQQRKRCCRANPQRSLLWEVLWSLGSL